MPQSSDTVMALPHKITRLFADLPQVAAVALGGSQVGNSPDATSDIDLYVYTCGDTPLAVRETIVDQSGRAFQANLGYSTCFWNTIQQAQVLHDPQGWFQALQDQCQQG